MKTRLAAVCVAMLGTLGAVPDATAQNLVIANAKILDGTGTLIESGYVVVRDGKIASVSAGAAPSVPGARVIDARGLTVMPGFIESHRHPVGGNGDEWLAQRAPAQMQEFLDAGFTAVLSAGDSPQHVVEMKRRIEGGQVKGPRLIAAGRVATARGAGPAPAAARGTAPGRAGGPPAGDPARFDRSRPPLRPTEPAGKIPDADTVAAVEAISKIGVDLIKTVIIATPGGPERDTLALIVREGKKRNLPTLTHAVSVEDTLVAVEAGVTTLAHTPHIGQLTPEQAKRIADAGIPMMSTLGIFLPVFDSNNTPLFRDRLPFPWETISSGGQGPVNARMLVNAGMTYAYGTDSSWAPRDSLDNELRALHLMFSPKDIVTIITKNASIAVGRQSQIGTLEPGKLADLVIIDGDPLSNIFDLKKVVTTIKGGDIVSDRMNRSRPAQPR